MFGIAKDIRSEVRVCTPELMKEALDSPHVARICAEIEDALEKCRRGEINKEDYETIKANLKKKLPILTFHATFKNGRRKNDDAVPSGLSIYDLDHIENPRAKWNSMKGRSKELGIILAHISPSLEGLRLVFVMPKGMSLAEAQAWMASQLGDDKYDACVKDYARCSFVVPRGYVLFLDEEGLFSNDRVEMINDREEGKHPENNYHLSPVNYHLEEFPTTYEDIPYESIVEVLEEKMGGEHEHGSRNNFIFSMACHLRYVCNDDSAWIAQILPTYGEAREKWLASIRSACNRHQTKKMPRIMKRTLSICQQRMEEEELNTQNSELNAPPKMPNRLPPLIKLLVSRTPKIYQPAVAHAVFPALGAHLWKTYFRYIDNVEHEATLMCCLMAGTGAGKNCIS